MNISSIRDCFGCGVCALACGKNIIDIRLNKEGFYEPFVHHVEECTHCGLCVDVCSYLHDDLSLKNPRITSYGAWSKDAQVRLKCSSGGMAFELGKAAISQGYQVCGVRYNPEKNRAEHYIASNITELIPSIGSKYLQSYTVDGFQAIRREQKYLVTGTPCQIDSFRRYIQKFHGEEHFILLDFFCHGVPSKWLWDKYVAMHERQIGKLIYASWRNKLDNGWHDSYAIGLEGTNKHSDAAAWHGDYDQDIRERRTYVSSRMSQQDLFYKLFLSDLCLGKACYDKCRFKYDHSSADIRIGDAWGSHYQADEKGVTATIAFTEKGHELLKMCPCVLEPLPLEVVAEGQTTECPQRKPVSRKVMEVLMQDSSTMEELALILRRYYFKRRIIDSVMHPMLTLSSIISKFLK